jgi:hypothetical protein
VQQSVRRHRRLLLSLLVLPAAMTPPGLDRIRTRLYFISRFT